MLLGSCVRGALPRLESRELFRLGYGKLEGELDMFRTGLVGNTRTRLVMSDGLFYIANGASNKVMEFTSYGDLITLFYNPQENPQPVSVQSRGQGERLFNLKAIPHAFIDVGEVAVTSDKIVLVEDRVPDRLVSLDEELGVKPNRIVVRFDPASDQVDYLGQEGVGGSYFPYIQRLSVTNNDEIVVVTVADAQWLVFWFDSEGRLLRKITIRPESLPASDQHDAIPILESIVPDRELPRLYLKMNYYVPSRDEETGARFGIEELISRIYWISADDGVYEGYVDVPRNTRRDRLRDERQEYYYELIDAAPGEHLFLLSQITPEISELLILHTGGRVVRRREIVLDSEEVLFRDLDVSSGGILSALFATRADARVLWWRTDRLFDVPQG